MTTIEAESAYRRSVEAAHAASRAAFPAWADAQREAFERKVRDRASDPKPTTGHVMPARALASHRRDGWVSLR